MSQNLSRIRVGIFLGGKSREREISFAGGRTVFDNLDKSLFEPIPIFVDSLGGFIELDWSCLYKGTIRDFFPGSQINDGSQPWQVYADSLEMSSPEVLNQIRSRVGKPLAITDFPGRMDVAFLCLHGPFGEDGAIQGLLEWVGIPYTGSGIFPSAFGIDKGIQRRLLERAGFDSPRHLLVSKSELGDWSSEKLDRVLENIRQTVGFPFVVKAPHQGSSIGVTVVQDPSLESFRSALERSFFLQKIEKTTWEKRSESERIQWIHALLDVRTGLGLPVSLYQTLDGGPPKARCLLPEELLNQLDDRDWEVYWMEGQDAEDQVLVESFIEGKEFSCIVVENEDGQPVALPPTEIRKSSAMFDYRAKYLPGISRKVTPIEVPDEQLESIRMACERMYREFGFEVYARLDGFVQADGRVFLNDPNTTSGMLPSSFFFHQSAEIGLNPSQFITYILERSLKARLKNGKNRHRILAILHHLDKLRELRSGQASSRTRVGVIMGGYSTERHISLESGRNIYEKLSSSAQFEPVPIFLTGNESAFALFELPIKYMLKDNADDVAYLVHHPKSLHPFVKSVMERAGAITQRYAGNALFQANPLSLDQLADRVDAVFIGLHGRPGEDGSLQVELEKRGIPYNGSGVDSSRLTINKFQTNEILRQNGILVADHAMVWKEGWEKDSLKWQTEIESRFRYPFIAKPADDGCSSAVKKIKNGAELQAFAALMFRETEEKPEGPARVLDLRPSEEFPQKSGFLIETLIGKEDALHFLEVTGGMLTRKGENGERMYEVFEPSETLASGEVLSLEEKFLAGEGQNITPARFSKNPEEQRRIAAEVKRVLEKTARVMNVEGYCRIDAFVRIFADGRVETLIIEINSLPGMTPATCIFHQAAIANLKPLDFISAILEYGRARVPQTA